ncbi:MAG: RidA family protein [Burkholderiales bacterium]
MAETEARLRALGLVLPPPTPTHFSYLPALKHGNVVYVAGQIPKISADRLVATGLLGKDVDDAAARDAVRLCVLHALSWVAHLVDGHLDEVEQILRVNYFFQVGDGGGHRMSEFADVGSSLLVALFDARGSHPRSVVGVRELPRNAPVLINMDVAIRTSNSTGLAEQAG